MVVVFIVGSAVCLVAHQDARYHVCQSDWPAEIVHVWVPRTGCVNICVLILSCRRLINYSVKLATNLKSSISENSIANTRRLIWKEREIGSLVQIRGEPDYTWSIRFRRRVGEEAFTLTSDDVIAGEAVGTCTDAVVHSTVKAGIAASHIPALDCKVHSVIHISNLELNELSARMLDILAENLMHPRVLLLSIKAKHSI